MTIRDEDFYQFMRVMLDDHAGVPDEAMRWMEYWAKKSESKDVHSILKQTIRVGNRYCLKADWIR